MRTHKYIHDPAELLSEGRQIVSESVYNKYIHRVSMVLLVLSGLSPRKLSDLCGVSERTLQTWVKKVDEEGWHALMDVRQKGRPGRLTREQIREIRSVVKAGQEQTGRKVWDGPVLSAFIREKYGIEYSIRTCQLLLHRMGFSLTGLPEEASPETGGAKGCRAVKMWKQSGENRPE